MVGKRREESCSEARSKETKKNPEEEAEVKGRVKEGGLAKDVQTLEASSLPTKAIPAKPLRHHSANKRTYISYSVIFEGAHVLISLAVFSLGISPNGMHVLPAHEQALRGAEERAHTANALKASGTSSDAYTPAELQQCALWCVSESKTSRELFRGVRDRAMLLVSAGTAFRGDSARMVQWSDLFISEVPLQEVRPDYLLPVGVCMLLGFFALSNVSQVLGVYSDNAKHNQQGRVDEFGMIRHRIVELCPIGATALLFWAHFHVLECPPPDFAPDFTDKNFGQFGRRDWYSCHLFYGTEVNKAMSYDNHYDRIKRIHEACMISLTKVTHATRHFGAQNARNHGASVNGAKAMGGWSDSGSYRACYDRTFPLDALLASAMFNGRDPSSYFLARDTLDPPQDLLLCTFPWVEEQESALLARQSAHRSAADIALYQFLRVLKWFRRVLLQDAAVLFCRYPSLPMFGYVPFNGARFQEYAKGASDAIAAAELRARCAFENVPVNLVTGMQALLTESHLARERDAANVKAYHERMMQRVDALELAVVSQKPTRTSRKTRAGAAADAAAAATFAVPAAVPAAAPSSAPFTVPAAPAPVVASVVMPPPSLSPAAPPLPHPAFHHPATASSAPAYSLALPAPAPAPWLPSNPLPVTTPDPRTKKRDLLLQKYGQKCIACHEWRLVDGQLTPVYALQAVKTVSDVWTEYTLGLNERLPVRELEESWGPKWRMNVSGVKTEWSRRKPIIGIITELADKPCWSVDLALRFLQTEFKSYSARKFYEYIKKAENHQEVIEHSNSFP
ncbi:hypothetical protein EWM64_g142 [Hericium alpestre]|uniref:Transcription activator GCR1-like domain-containing protein n=1 Tax=Hericium alpestre TaxID=135208 RepID=A0A4Z0A9T4_9AGAM|nr:hypothetical protein EWM64_g142 [Hericium alpestre]